jgi:hypothetical protein
MIALLVCASTALLSAAEPHNAFLDGLRAHKYYDTAIEYLEIVEKDPQTPAEFKVTILYEKAVTLQAAALASRTLDDQRKKLTQAEAYLKQFVSQSPDHPLAATANSQSAKLLLNKAKVEYRQARNPSNLANKAEFQKTARGYIGQARAMYQKAHDDYKIAWEAFKKFIPDSEKELRAQRSKAEVNYIRAQLDLASCTYELAQTYDKDAPEFSKTLNDASKEYEEIHSRYRSQIGGLHARMWQGKCFEEQDDVQKALGIYNELLGHPGKSSGLVRMKDQVRQFRLIVLNHPKKTDYELVNIEGNEWLKLNKAQHRRIRGLGIRWEVARAQEQLGSDKNRSAEDRGKYLEASLANAMFVNSSPGPYKDPSMAMVRRLKVLLKGDAGDPEDFDTALGLARGQIKGIKKFSDDLKSTTDRTARATIQKNLDAHLQETTHNLKLALTLATPETTIKQLNEARYLLAYVYYREGRDFETAVIGEYLGKQFAKDDPGTALDAAYLSIAAYVRAYNRAPKDDRDFEIDHIVTVGELVHAKFPNTTKANDARMILGRLFRDRKQPVEAASWYLRVPESSEDYTKAVLNAGQAYWNAYLEAAILPEDDPQRPPLEEFKKWRDEAENHLLDGIHRRSTEVPEDATVGNDPNDPLADLIAAKLSLVQILNGRGDYPAAVDFIMAEPQSIIRAIEYPEEQTRPTEGVKRMPFAILTFQQLLRGYVGQQKIDEALDAMEKLKSLDETGDNTAIYVELGRELQKEIARLKSLKETERLAEVRASFDEFLTKLFEQKSGQTYGSLIWIAETYYGLGEGLGGDDGGAESAAADYFDKAGKTYQDILDRSDELGEEIKTTGVKLRLVNCRRRQADFETAYELVKDVLKEIPNAIDAQIEAARLFQSWAASGPVDADEKYQKAMRGETIGKGKNPLVIWGWGGLGQRLLARIQRNVATPKQVDQHLDARYNATQCRHEFALSQTATTKKNEELEKAEFEIVSIMAIAGDINDKWFEKFDSLYGNIQIDRGIDPKKTIKLQRPKQIGSDNGGPPLVLTDDDTENVVEPPPSPKKKTAGTNPMLLVLLCVGGAVGVYFMMAAPGKKRKLAYADLAPMPQAAGAPPSHGKGRKVIKKKKKAPAKTATGSPPATKKKVVKKKKAPAGAAPKKKKKRPPGS